MILYSDPFIKKIGNYIGDHEYNLQLNMIIIFPTAYLANMGLYASYFRSNNPKQ